MGKESSLDRRHHGTPERIVPAADLCRLLVRDGRHRDARLYRHRPDLVGVRFSTHYFDLSAFLGRRRAFAERRFAGRSRESFISQRSAALPARSKLGEAGHWQQPWNLNTELSARMITFASIRKFGRRECPNKNGAIGCRI